MSFKISFFSAVALSLATVAGLSSCGNDDLLQQESGRGPMSISISTAEDHVFKSSLYNKNRAKFDAGDKISVFDGTTNNEFTTENGGNAAMFKGEAILGLGKYWFLYPYQSTATLSKDNNLLTVTIPTTQTAVADNFDPAALLSVGIGTEKAAVLKNVCCLLKFTVNDGADVKKVTLKGDAPLTGNVVVSASDATIITAVKTANEVVMTGDFVDGTTYYLSVLPGTHTGIELSAEDSNGHVTSKSSGAFIFERSQIHDLGYTGAVSQIKGNPLCFTAEEENSTVALNKVESANWMLLDYSTDGATWANYTMGTIVTLPNAGDKVFFRNRYTYADVKVNSSNRNYYKFGFSGQIAASGNIMSLLCKNMEVDTAPSYCFYRMFSDCSVLTSAPEMPATILSSYCYGYMFSGCSLLAAAPKLPATKLASYCYEYMFQNCKNITEAPELPAPSLASYCYHYMFSDCTSLVVAPVLPAATLSDCCYGYMFQNCTSLLTPPALPAMTLTSSCYTHMFSGCKNLESAPILPAANGISGCYFYMFYHCPKINYIEVALTATNNGSYCSEWLNGTADYGTVVCPSTFKAAGLYNSGDSYIPSGWVVINIDLEGSGVHNEIYSEGAAPVWE